MTTEAPPTPFDTFLRTAWSDHAKDSDSVARRLPEGLALLESPAEVVLLGNLATHVYGEHLGRWNEGLQFLGKLETSVHYGKDGAEVEGSVAAIERFMTALKLCAGNEDALATLATKSDQARVLALAASALSARGTNPPTALERAQSYFQKSIRLAENGLEKTDPANRALAVMGNNLAVSLAGTETISGSETELMILAAKAARKFWEIAGTWLEVERAEYRLSLTFLKVGDFSAALEHAQNCLELCQENRAEALEFFFGFEALALAEQARENKLGLDEARLKLKEAFGKLSPEDQAWCEETFQKFTT
jgi:tetratricopeptide (TPR) repeat protein